MWSQKWTHNSQVDRWRHYSHIVTYKKTIQTDKILNEASRLKNTGYSCRSCSLAEKHLHLSQEMVKHRMTYPVGRSHPCGRSHPPCRSYPYELSYPCGWSCPQGWSYYPLCRSYPYGLSNLFCGSFPSHPCGSSCSWTCRRNLSQDQLRILERQDGKLSLVQDF